MLTHAKYSSVISETRDFLRDCRWHFLAHTLSDLPCQYLIIFRFKNLQVGLPMITSCLRVFFVLHYLIIIL